MSESTKLVSPIVVDFEHMDEVLKENHIIYDRYLEKEDIKFCKIEAQQYCMMGTLCIPKLQDNSREKIPVALFLTDSKIVIVDDEGIVKTVIDKIEKIIPNPYESIEKFMYFFLTELMADDIDFLDNQEEHLLEIEKEVLDGVDKDFSKKSATFRRKMLILRCYYEEMSDVGKTLEENENEYFDDNKLKYYGIASDRADRLMNKTVHLLELGREVKETYDSKISARQNANMQFLTVMSAVFFPLTLITGWYGMNFENMPELASGYPFVIGGSVLVVLGVVILFKIKKIL